MRRSSFADRPERAVAPRTLAELMATDEAAPAADEDQPAAARRTRRAPRAARTLRNAA
ncbi:hypothetical protein AB0J52_30585 [Spirillospora sp. NPDC049652]